jgi:hypothetical protein
VRISTYCRPFASPTVVDNQPSTPRKQYTEAVHGLTTFSIVSEKTSLALEVRGERWVVVRGGYAPAVTVQCVDHDAICRNTFKLCQCQPSDIIRERSALLAHGCDSAQRGLRSTPSLCPPGREQRRRYGCHSSEVLAGDRCVIHASGVQDRTVTRSFCSFKLVIDERTTLY